MKIKEIRQTEMQFYKAPVTTTVSNQTLTAQLLHELVRSDKYKDATEALRRIKNKDEKGAFKKTHFDFVTASCTSTKRCAEAVTKRTNMLTIDIDNYPGDVDLLKAQLVKDPQLFTIMAFISPSGNGLKWIVLIDESQARQEEWYQAIGEYLKQTYQVVIDKQCGDVCRACFLPYDEYAYINDLLTNSDNDDLEVESMLNVELWLKKAQQHQAQLISSTLVHHANPYTKEEDLQALLQKVKENGINLTQDYDSWTRIGQAIAYHYGEAGRTIFHEFSQQDARYNPTESDKKYDSYLRNSSTNTPCKLPTIFYLAQQQGIDIAHLHTKEKENCEVFGGTGDSGNVNISESVEHSFKAPTFSNLVSGHIPSLFQDIIDLMDTWVKKDMMLFGAIPILCCILHFIVGIYDGRRVYPLWFAYLYAHAGCSKGILTALLKLSDPIEAQIRAENEQEMEQYQEAMRTYQAQQKDKSRATGELPMEPPYRSMYLPANSSSSATYRGLNNNHGWGLIFETEGDVLANTLSKDYGDYSTGLRNAFHHEPIRMSRSTNNEHIHIARPNFSCLLSGTPGQVRSLFPSAENGLPSRFLFYDVPQSLEWHNVFAQSATSLDEDMEKIGKRLFTLYSMLKESGKPITFKLTGEQQEKFNQFFAKEQDEFYELAGWDIVASVRRLALSAFRLMMLFSVCRLEGTTSVPDTLTCTDEDFESCITIMDVLMQHTLHVFSTIIPPTENNLVLLNSPLTRTQQTFFNSLPDEFTTQQYKAIADQQGMPVKTAEKLVNRLMSKYSLVERIKQGVYQKIKPAKK